MLHPSLSAIKQGDIRALAGGITLIENQAPGSLELLKELPASPTPVIGITGPPGAGKSSIVNALTGILVNQGKKVAILCIDPSSPFHHGALLGDRIRMNQWSGHQNVYIRSLASRGSLGGLHPRIFEITDLLKASPYDFILVETVGIGQSELEIASLADLTIVVLTPGSGDEIQAMKAGMMEIADLFVVNKSDHPESKQFISHLKSALHLGAKEITIIETTATEGKGIDLLADAIAASLHSNRQKEPRNLTEKAYRLILAEKMKTIDKKELFKKIQLELPGGNFNVYRFVEDYLAEDPKT
jgi:LAO/AO transport system kinase